MSGKNVRVLLLCLSFLCCFTISTGFPSHASAASVTRSTQATSATAKPAINRVSCDGRTDFLEIWSGQYLDCFANSGIVNVNIIHVFQICSGNNLAYIFFTGSETLGIPSWTCDAIPDTSVGVNSTSIVQIQII